MSDVEIIGKLELVNINTPDGDFGFIVGTDGFFTDVNGKNWFGSQLIKAGRVEQSVNGIAPAGELSMSFFQDPDAPDLIGQVKSLGNDYINGRLVKFYVQPITDPSELYNPMLPPELLMTRVMRTLKYSTSGAQSREIAITFESVFENRRRARRLVYNTVDHSKLIGRTNPSLEFIPTVDFQEQKLFD